MQTYLERQASPEVTKDLTKRYEMEYQDLNPTYIFKLVELINYSILSPFDPKYETTDRNKRSCARFIKDIAQKKEITEERKKVADITLVNLYYLNTSFEEINDAFQERGLPSVQNPEEYLPLTNKITEEISITVINTLRNNGTIKSQRISGIIKDNIENRGIKRQHEEESELEEQSNKKQKSSEPLNSTTKENVDMSNWTPSPISSPYQVQPTTPPEGSIRRRSENEATKKNVNFKETQTERLPLASPEQFSSQQAQAPQKESDHSSSLPSR